MKRRFNQLYEIEMKNKKHEIEQKSIQSWFESKNGIKTDNFMSFHGY